MIKKKNETQTNLETFFNFDRSNSFEKTPESLNTSTQGTDFTFKPVYSCRTRRGYSLFSDPFNEWRRQKEPADYSRQDIAFSYRVGGGF
jgi:CRISPR/Cas system CSM-associated protein Csm3 (group 7 of RAMP superfamily)